MNVGPSDSECDHSPSSGPKEAEGAHLTPSNLDRLDVLDIEGRLLSTNAKGAGSRNVESAGTGGLPTWVDAWREEDQDRAREALEAARQGKDGRFVGCFSDSSSSSEPPGTTEWWEVLVSPIFGADGRPEKLLAASRNATKWRNADALLRAITVETSHVTGRDFFRALVQKIAQSLGVHLCFVAECVDGQRARALSSWLGNQAGPDFEYPLQGTPCFEVMEGRTCHHECHLWSLFPEDRPLEEMGMESYLGVPMRDSNQNVIGHLVIMDTKPMPKDPLVLSVMEIFAARAGVEWERARAFDLLYRQHQESEERFRDLFDEAPIAYVHEGLDTRFIRANRAALRILGIRAEDVTGTYGQTFIPDTPEAQRRLKEALESIGKGTDTSGVVLELRRKDNGKPIWIQWWSKPDLGGQFTRTMFLDITERVLMEQEKARLEAQNVYLQEEIRSEHHFDEIVGRSPALAEVLRRVDQVARLDSTVLIGGETGTGKELIARAIHDRSARRSRALVKVNCGAISAGLVESELFGHVKGAFTGAISPRDGRFKLADGGTLFLDEVGELPLDTQVKLLRVLQEQEFEPIGSSRTLKVNVRVLAATNRDLQQLVREGKFRADLFYRLNVFPLRLPSLRERPTDLPLLITFFTQKFAKNLGRPIRSVSAETMRRLTAYDWPGNVRELQNVIERAVILSPGTTLEMMDELRPAATTAAAPVSAPQADPRATQTDIIPSGGSTPKADTADAALEDVEKRHIESILQRTRWVIEGAQGAAAILGMRPSTLRSRMQKLGIQRPDRRGR